MVSKRSQSRQSGDTNSSPKKARRSKADQTEVESATPETPKRSPQRRKTGRSTPQATSKASPPTIDRDHPQLKGSRCEPVSVSAVKAVILDPLSQESTLVTKSAALDTTPSEPCTDSDVSPKQHSANESATNQTAGSNSASPRDRPDETAFPPTLGSQALAPSTQTSSSTATPTTAAPVTPSEPQSPSTGTPQSIESTAALQAQLQSLEAILKEKDDSLDKLKKDLAHVDTLRQELAEAKRVIVQLSELNEQLNQKLQAATIPPHPPSAPATNASEPLRSPRRPTLPSLSPASTQPKLSSPAQKSAPLVPHARLQPQTSQTFNGLRPSLKRPYSLQGSPGLPPMSTQQPSFLPVAPAPRPGLGRLPGSATQAALPPMPVTRPSHSHRVDELKPNALVPQRTVLPAMSTERLNQSQRLPAMPTTPTKRKIVDGPKLSGDDLGWVD